MAEKHALIPDLAAMYAPTDAKDLSKNLMSGDFERQYSSGKVKKCSKWKQASVVVLAVTVAALVVWLLALSMIRETQLTRLRQEVDELTASVIAMSANVKTINQKIDDLDTINQNIDGLDGSRANNNKHQSVNKNTDDTIYADEDQDITNLADGRKKKSKPQDNSLEKLHGLTVLEDDNLGDDEDPLELETDEEESGDWYPDYDSRAEKVGTTNMVHLKPEDFTDSGPVLTKQALFSNIREIRRLLNENPENPNLPALLPSTEATKETSDESRPKRSVFPDSPADAVDEFAVPRVMTKPEDRRKTKKFNSEATPMALHTVTRTVRNSDNDVPQRRPFIAAHFHGNTSHLSTEIHEHYKGNGLVRVSHGAAHDVWYPAPWTAASPHPRPTLMRNGHVHVHHTGVYLVYVQIYYLDSHDIISWVLHRTNPDTEGRETLLQCAQSSHSTERLDKPNSCFSAAALFLKSGDKLAVRNTGGDRHSLMEPEKSFIGLVKLADAEDPTQEL